MFSRVKEVRQCRKVFDAVWCTRKALAHRFEGSFPLIGTGEGKRHYSLTRRQGPYLARPEELARSTSFDAKYNVSCSS
jgi:hypothetical protein